MKKYLFKEHDTVVVNADLALNDEVTQDFQGSIVSVHKDENSAVVKDQQDYDFYCDLDSLTKLV